MDGLPLLYMILKIQYIYKAFANLSDGKHQETPSANPVSNHQAYWGTSFSEIMRTLVSDFVLIVILADLVSNRSPTPWPSLGVASNSTWLFLGQALSFITEKPEFWCTKKGSNRASCDSGHHDRSWWRTIATHFFEETPHIIAVLGPKGHMGHMPQD